ncbi:MULTISPECIES: hypothetical protein [unclassified Ensifer]|uniref:hypothetical protein n=1 Tax=unclassified Ensifer TaxID=2633371 RepID=UPI001FCE16C4|nr:MULTISPECIES: hypothetical protein [unclassified Ensifer]
MGVGQLTFSLPEVLDFRPKAASPSFGDGPAKDVEPHQVGLQFARAVKNIPNRRSRHLQFSDEPVNFIAEPWIAPPGTAKPLDELGFNLLPIRATQRIGGPFPAITQKAKQLR